MYKRRYETVAIVNPDSGTDGIDKVMLRMRDAIERTEGKEVRYEDWGRRRLAFEMRKQAKGHYIYLQYIGTNQTVPELERLLGITEEAMKYQTIVLDSRVIEADFDFKAAGEERTGMERAVVVETPEQAPAEAAETADAAPEKDAETEKKEEAAVAEEADDAKA